jgi:hypothetical protein
MSKIELSPLPSGFATTAALNARFQQIEDALNNDVLWRDNPEGEPNSMDNELDMDSNEIINVPPATEPHHPVILEQIEEVVAEAVADLDLSLGNVIGPASSLDSQVAEFNGVTGRLLKASSQYQKTIENVAALALTPVVAGRTYYLKEYHAGTGKGGRDLVGVAGSTTYDNVLTFAGSGGYFESINASLTFLNSGGHPSRTAAQNLAALKLLIAACPINGLATVDQEESEYVIDCTGGLSAAAVINKKMTLVINGCLKSNFGTMQTNPPYLINITGDDVVIAGSGKIEGDGTVDDTNAGTELTFPGLLHVTGDRFVCTLQEIDTPPKVGILLNNCDDAEISVKNWHGGVTSYTIGNTAYFGIRATGGIGHKFHSNGFNDDGGKFVSAIFTGGNSGKSNNLSIYNNKNAKVWEKLCYLYTDESVIHDNSVSDALIADTFRIDGSNNKAYNNSGDNVFGVFTVYDGVGNEIHDNSFTNIQQIGCYVGRLSGSYTGGFNNTKITGNKFYADTGSSDLTSGIDVVVDGASSSNIDVSDNDVQGFGDLFDEGNIRVRAITPYVIAKSRVDDNYVDGGLRAGVILDRVNTSSMSRNKGGTITEYMLVEINGANNDIIDNSATTVGSLGINALSATSYCSGNKYTDKALTGASTLSAAITTTVTHGGIAPNARVFLQTGNDAAGIMIVAKGWPTTATSGSDFTITMANGTAAAGTESFLWRVEQ